MFRKWEGLWDPWVKSERRAGKGQGRMLSKAETWADCQGNGETAHGLWAMLEEESMGFGDGLLMGGTNDG